MADETKADDIDLSILTEAERAGLLQDDADEGEETTTPEDENTRTPGDVAAAPDAPAPPAADDAPPPAEAATKTADERVRPVEVPLIRADDPGEAKARLAAISEELDALAAKFDDGDMTAKEYNGAVKTLNDESRDLDWKLRKAELAAEVAEQQRAKAWSDDVGEFLAAHPEIGANKLTLISFDAAVRAVTGDDANAGLSNRDTLETALRDWRAAFGVVAPQKTKGVPATEADGTGKPPPGRERRPAPPPTLAAVPASQATETDDGRFAALDRLAEADPTEYERRLATLPEAERDAYLRGA